MGRKDKVFFDSSAQAWNVPEKNIRIADEVIERLNIKPDEKV